MNMKPLFEQLIQGEPLTPSQMKAVLTQCMHNALTDVQIASFLAFMRMKGETVEELTAAAETIRSFSNSIDLGDDLIDIVGTGGDGQNTLNVSTISSFVAAAAGARVAKHGNHSVSSRSGSADMLIQAGFHLNLSHHQLQRCLQTCNIAFLFAPHFHQALKHVREARKQLGIRTLFNLIGPLLNPANVKKQVIGVYDATLLKPIASVLANLGSEHVLAVHSRDKLDEISIAAQTDVVEYHQGQFKHWVIDPKRFGCHHETLTGITVDSPAQSLALAESVFSGQQGPARDIILLNTAAALYLAGLCSNYHDGIEKAAEAIDSGKAKQLFLQLNALSQPIT